MSDAVCFCGTFAHGLCVRCHTPICGRCGVEHGGRLHCGNCGSQASREEKVALQVRVELLRAAGAFKRKRRTLLAPGGLLVRPFAEVTTAHGVKLRVDDRGNVTTRDGLFGSVTVDPWEPRHEDAFALLCARYGIDEHRVATLTAARLSAAQA